MARTKTTKTETVKPKVSGIIVTDISGGASVKTETVDGRVISRTFRQAPSGGTSVGESAALGLALSGAAERARTSPATVDTAKEAAKQAAIKEVTPTSVGTQVEERKATYFPKTGERGFVTRFTGGAAGGARLIERGDKFQFQENVVLAGGGSARTGVSGFEFVSSGGAVQEEGEIEKRTIYKRYKK